MRSTLWVVAFFALAVCRLGAALERQPNSSLQMPPQPPVQSFTWTNAFPGLVFTNPVCMASPPGETNRLFVLEKRGRVIVITNLANPTRTLFLDITARVSASDSVSDEQGLLGIAFHPGYATNRSFCLYYTGNATTTAGGGRHDILARYEALTDNPNAADTAETRIILQRDEAGNHNGGDLHFGPDGYLYLSLGDEGGSNDSYGNSQQVDNDFFSGILRIDIDKRPGNLPPNPHPAATTNYLVPADNPFVGLTSFNGVAVDPGAVRTEFWAVGLRNPWRMAFDSLTGTLYVGDVGQGSREEISIIRKGGNYGWTHFEGFLQRNAQPPAGFEHSPPLIDYPRSLGYSVTGGRVYRGTRISQLHGAYLYADYGSGRIWALRHEGTNVTQNQVLFSNPLGGPFNAGGISAFGVDPSNGDILYTDLRNGTDSIIKRIVYAPGSSGTPLPETLAETGAFADLATLEPQAGIVPYELNLPFWSDGAGKGRWFSIPDTNKVMTFKAQGLWGLPAPAVWIKHFEIELTNGIPESARRLETRLLVHNTNGGYGVTYRWGDNPTNASLVAESGEDETFVIYHGDGSIARTQTWHYPSRVECLQCHNSASGFALGFTASQLNRDHNYGGHITNQIAAFAQAGYFANPVSNLHTLRALAPPANEAVSREYRARSWLAVNCANCHRPGGVQMAFWDAREETPTGQAGIIDGPLVDDHGIGARVVVPGSTSLSEVLRRIATTGPGRMPPISSSVVDTQAVELLSAWITNDLPAFQTYEQWQTAQFGSTNAPNSGRALDADGDLASNELEYLTGTDPLAPADHWSAGIARAGESAALSFPQIANRGFQVETSADITSPAWQPLDVPANAPFFPITNRLWAVPDTLTGTNRYYRIGVFSP